MDANEKLTAAIALLRAAVVDLTASAEAAYRHGDNRTGNRDCDAAHALTIDIDRLVSTYGIKP